jgi:hypothetical protein
MPPSSYDALIMPLSSRCGAYFSILKHDFLRGIYIYIVYIY